MRINFRKYKIVRGVAVKILITGADSFIGKNLIAELITRKYTNICELNDCGDIEQLKNLVGESNFIFHLQTVYRSEDVAEFEQINTDTTQRIIELIGKRKKTLLLLSSTQAVTDSPYGISKNK